MYALNSKRLEQLRHALRCLDAAKLRLPVTIQCFPGCQRPAAREMLDSLRRSFRFNVTVWTDDDLDDKTFRRSTLHKAVAAYHSPYRRTLVMDTDACVRSSRLTQMFGPLADFDFVSVWECCAKGAMSAYKTGMGASDRRLRAQAQCACAGPMVSHLLQGRDPLRALYQFGPASTFGHVAQEADVLLFSLCQPRSTSALTPCRMRQAWGVICTTAWWSHTPATFS